MANVLDDLTSRFKLFGDALAGGIDKSFTQLAEGIDKSFLNAKNDARPHGTQPIASTSRISTNTAETEAARQRAELILQNLPGSYYEQAADPLEHELRQMGDESKQEDIDGVVDRLTAAVEVVSVKLAKHVVKNQDKLIAGITNVIEVEDDLKAAHVICRGTRSQLKMAAEEVQRQVKVITCTRKKQAYMTVLEVLCKVKRVQDLQNDLRTVHDTGDFAEAILLCLDCFQAVESLAVYKVAPELQVTVQRQYFDTQQRLKAALMQECNFFTGEGYSKLLEAYLLQGLSGPDLATKIMSCFKESISDTAGRLVRSMVLASAVFHADGSDGLQAAANGSLQRSSHANLDDASYEDLCKQLSSDSLQPCLRKLLEIVYEVLCSYHLMQQWHEAGIQQQKQAAAAAAAAVRAAAEHRANSDSGSRSSRDSSSAGAAVEPGQQQEMLPSQEQLDQVQAATKSMLEAVAQGLASSRPEIMELASSRVQPILMYIGKCKGDEFSKVVDICMQSVVIGEAYVSGQLPLRQTLLSSVSSSIEAYHKTNMDALKLSLALENWQPVSSSDRNVNSMKQSVSSNVFAQLPAVQPGTVKDFNSYVQAGNPFKDKPSGRTAGGQSSLPNSSGQATDTAAAATQPAPPTSAPSNRVATKSSLLVLQCLSNYAALMAPLPPRQAVLWAAVAEIFDNFFLACFILFSGVTLEALVRQEDLLPHRLRSALLRITTSKGCKYKVQVEELMRTKPEAPAAPSSSLLDFGFIGSTATPGSGSSSPSKLDVFTKRFKDTMVDIINTDFTQPATSTGTYSPQGYHAAPPPRGQSPVPLQQQQQQQQQLQQRTGAAGPLQPVTIPTSPAPSPEPLQPQQQQQHGPMGRQFGIKERVVAIESLTAIADALKAAKSGLQAVLGAAMAKEVDNYFARTVDTAQDLRDAIYRGGAKQLLSGVVDLDRGTAAQIASCNYNTREPATAYQPWVEALLKQYRAFNDFVKVSGLPTDVQQKLWEAAVKLGCDAMLSGFSRIYHCSLPGRASMSLDLSAVEKALRTLAPASAMSSFRPIDNYVKAFYIPWDDLARWSQIHVAEYGRAKIMALIEAMAEAHGVKRATKAALVDKLNVELAEFA